MSTSVSQFSEMDVDIRNMKKEKKINETDVEIHFILFRNRSRHLFLKKKIVKRMSKSISEKYETDLDIHFNKKQNKIVKQMSRSISYFS